MTPVQIAYFKHFLYDTGVNRMYVYRYRHFRIKQEGEMPGNPESIEQFFLEQPYFRVVMKAFYIEMNSQYGYDFWKEIDHKWKKYWEMHEDNINNQGYIMLKGNFGVLRQNWDKPAFWRKENLETNEETYKRMNIEPPIPEDSAATLCKFEVGDTIQSHISEEVQTIISISPEGYELSDGGIVEFDKERYWMKVDPQAKAIESEKEPEEEVSNTDYSEVPEAQEEKPNICGSMYYRNWSYFFKLHRRRIQTEYRRLLDSFMQFLLRDADNLSEQVLKEREPVCIVSTVFCLHSNILIHIRNCF